MRPTTRWGVLFSCSKVGLRRTTSAPLPGLLVVWRNLMLPYILQRATTFRIVIFVALALSACQCAHAKKLRGDVVTMKNGDRLTGEVKGLASGVLFIETDYAS